MSVSRIEKRDRLLMQFGKVVAPVQRILDIGLVTREAIPYLESQFEADSRDFGANVDEFCRQGDHFFRNECNAVRAHLPQLGDYFRRISQPGNTLDGLRSQFTARCDNVLVAIRDIPCDDPDVILPAASPFQTYKRLRAICTGATNRLEVFDPYLDPTVFHLYAPEVPATAMLTVVADSGRSSPMSNPAKRAAIVAVSQLVALERQGKYRFCVTPSIHDRYLRADDMILHLGGSIAHAGRNDPYTISKLDPTSASHAMLDGIIAGADEWYGPNVTTHRTA